MSAENTLVGIKSVLEALRVKRPLAHVVLLGLLPRGDKWFKGTKMDMMTNIMEVNKVLEEEVSQGPPTGSQMIWYLNCGNLFLEGGESKIGLDGRFQAKVNQTLMPDSLHPNGDGARLWAECMKPTVDKLLALRR